MVPIQSFQSHLIFIIPCFRDGKLRESTTCSWTWLERKYIVTKKSFPDMTRCSSGHSTILINQLNDFAEWGSPTSPASLNFTVTRIFPPSTGYWYQHHLPAEDARDLCKLIFVCYGFQTAQPAWIKLLLGIGGRGRGWGADTFFHFKEKKNNNTFSLNCKRYAVTALPANQNRLPKSICN